MRSTRANPVQQELIRSTRAWSREMGQLLQSAIQQSLRERPGPREFNELIWDVARMTGIGGNEIASTIPWMQSKGLIPLRSVV